MNRFYLKKNAATNDSKIKSQSASLIHDIILTNMFFVMNFYLG